VVDPQLRGRVSPATLERFRARGLTVHRIGRAAYVHGRGQRWIFEVRGRGDPPAPFAPIFDDYHRHLIGRGPIPRRYRRLVDRMLRVWRLERLRDAGGRFAGRTPWWWGVDGLTWPRRLA
jgi:hypothetical protein